MFTYKQARLLALSQVCAYLWEHSWRLSFSPAGVPSHRADLDLGKLSWESELTEDLSNKRRSGVCDWSCLIKNKIYQFITSVFKNLNTLLVLV